MSLILKGIDIPKDETIIIHYANRYGEMETIFVDESDIIQIPKGHGNLIDGQRLFKLFQCQDILQKHDGKWESMFPIILEAER